MVHDRVIGFRIREDTFCCPCAQDEAAGPLQALLEARGMSPETHLVDIGDEEILDELGIERIFEEEAGELCEGCEDLVGMPDEAEEGSPEE